MSEEAVNELIRRAQQLQGKVIIKLIAGLQTDGAHHKQHYMEEALRLIIGDVQFDIVKKATRWKDGIAP